jgi:predicted Zn-dependent peptidase
MAFPSPRFAPPVPERRVLANGLVVHLLEDHQVPLATCRAIVRVGGVFDPPGLRGTARLLGDLMVEGGTEALPGRKLAEALEERSIDLGGSIGGQSGSFSVNAMSRDFPEALKLFADVLRRPALDGSVLEMIRGRQADEARRLVDQPDALAFREFRRFVYQGDPRGEAPTPAGIGLITREDASAMYRSHFHPERVILGCSGDFDSPRLVADIEALFGDWQPSGEAPPAMPLPSGTPPGGVVRFLEKDLPQSVVVEGYLAPPRESPDHVPFMVADFILGSAGFSSRLMREIRSNRGLAYSVGSFYRGDAGYGVFAATARTRNGTAAEVLALMRAEVGRMIREGIGADELAFAKDALVNAMIFRYAGPGSVVAEAIGLEYDRLPADFADRTARRIMAVTREEVAAAASRHFNLSNPVTVVVGGADALVGLPATHRIERITLDQEGAPR